MAVKDKVVVITGAARGMGRAYVRGFLEKGARVAALDRSWVPTGLSGDRDDAFARELEGRNDAIKLTCDVTDDEQIREAYEATMNRFGTVGVLINNASLRQINLFPDYRVVTTLDTTDSDFQKMFAVSFFGCLKVIRTFVTPMIERQQGSIINISSGGGMTVPQEDGVWALNRPNSREQPYQSAKAALTCLSGYLADELKPHNVAVNTVYPSGSRTTGWEDRALARGAATGEPPRLEGGIVPEHVVPIALWLAEQDAKNGVTGKIFAAMRWNEKNGFGGPESWTYRGRHEIALSPQVPGPE